MRSYRQLTVQSLAPSLAIVLLLGLAGLGLFLGLRDAGRDAEPAAKPGGDAGTLPARATPAPEAPPAVVSPPGEPARRVATGELECPGANLLIISLTNLRADHLGAYGYSRPTSPAVDSLARQGLVFDGAFTHASWTLPVAVSILTSQYPFTHGLMNRKSFEPLSPEIPTLIDALEADGYRTAAFVGDRDYSASFGHTSRFDYLYDSVSESELEDWHSAGVLSRTVPRAISWIRRNRESKFFALVQGYDVHCPFAIPERNDRFDPGYAGDVDFTRCYWTFGRTKPIQVAEPDGGTAEVYLLKTTLEEGRDYEALLYPEDVRHMEALYDGEIASADRLVGELLGELETLDLLERTVVVFLSEHGDMMGKHGRFMRGGPLRGTFYDDVIRVPLIVRHPTLQPARIGGLAMLIDLAPTLLDMLGLPAPETFAGKSLRPLILEGTPVNPHVFAGSAYTPKATSAFFRDRSIVLSVRGERWKLIHERLFLSGGPLDSHELYDLQSDPGELENLAAGDPERVAELEALLSGWLRGIRADAVLSDLER